MVLAGTITQKTLHPLTLLAQLVGRQVSGELLVVSDDVRWSLWLQRGKLLFATSSQNGFDTLRFEGRQLFPEAISDLVLAQLQLYHRQYTHQDSDLTADYRAVRWLFEQEHLTFEQSAQLVRALSITTLTSLLRVSRGSYEVNSYSNISSYPAFCTLDIRTLVEHCHREAEELSAKRTGLPISEIATMEKSIEANSLAGEELKVLLSKPSATPFDLSLQSRRVDNFQSTPIAQNSAAPSYQIVCIDSDSQAIRELSDYLEDTVFSIMSVDDVATAVADLAKCQPDLILLTTAMEGLDGFELCSHLRRHPQYKNVPIILLAKRPNLIGRIRAKLCGASHYIGKPINRTKLMVNLFTLLV